MPAKKTTVCWISSGRYQQPLTASEARKWQLLTALPNYEIRVIGFADSLRPRRFQEHARFYLLPKPPTAPLRYLCFFSLAPWLLLIFLLRRHCEILVAQSPYEGALGAALKLCARPLAARPRLIIENHNNFEEDIFLQRQIPFQRLYRALMLRSARFAFRQADTVRVISSSTAARARHYAPQLPQVRFMAFSDTEAFENSPRRIPVAEALDIVYAGVLIPRKAVHHLLPAFAALDKPQAQLYLVGHAENAQYAAALKQQRRALGLEGRVHFVGAVSQRELAGYFGAARALVLPSLSEGLGRVVLEAMLVGTPVIGSRVGGIPDMIQHGENGLLVAPGDEADLTAALRQIYALDVAAMGARARAFAQAFFSHDKYVAGYQALFESAQTYGRPAGESAAAE